MDSLLEAFYFSSSVSINLEWSKVTKMVKMLPLHSNKGKVYNHAESEIYLYNTSDVVYQL